MIVAYVLAHLTLSFAPLSNGYLDSARETPDL